MLDDRSRHLRRMILDLLLAGGRGHPASALSLVEILRVLYDQVLRHRPACPQWEDRDRLILSKGHGCMAQYVLLAEHGYFPRAELERFCKPDGLLGGHPEHGRVPGIEASTGALGHGLPIAVGMAIDARQRGRGHRVFAVLGDGESQEGSNWEAMAVAAKHRLERLTVVVDRNRQQSYGATAEVLDLEPFADKWRAFGAGVREVDGHDVAALGAAFAAPPAEPGRPTVVICSTIKGRGFPSMERNLAWHHRNSFTADEHRALCAELEAGHA